MPWNDNANSGPWGKPPGRDEEKPDVEPPQWPEPPRRPPPPPLRPGPDLAELGRKLAARIQRSLGGGAPRQTHARLAAIILGAFGLLWLMSGLYTVQANEEAVITQFGGYSRSEGPGLHYHLPIPIERAEMVPVTDQNKTVLGGVPGEEKPDESLMLTGDENIVDLAFTVQWHVSDAASYLFRVEDPKGTVKAVAESAMREIVGRNALKAILTNGRGAVQAETLALMQRILDRYRTGVTVDAVQIQNANPPSEVVPAYQDIAKADQEAQSSVNEADAYRNQKVNEARGSAAKIVQDAEGYREQVVREARGQAARFNQIYVQYRHAPAVTRERLYIETMQEIMARTHKVVIDAKGATAPIILPPDAFRGAAAAQKPAGQGATP